MTNRLTSLFEKYPYVSVNFINKLNPNENWQKEKKFNECTQEDKLKFNLRKIFPCEIVLDFENMNYEMTKVKLKELGITNFSIYSTGSRGIHISILFNNLDFFPLEHRNEIRKEFIKYFDGDISKGSELTYLAVEDKPHFKTGKLKILIEESSEMYNTLSDFFINKGLSNFIDKSTMTTINTDYNFKDYHNKDLFFNYIKNNIIPDDTNRDLNIFPNIAIALVKEGLTEQQIEDIVKPIIENNFPGKSYNEFKGWLKKAQRGEITTYNKIQLNNWLATHTNTMNFYNLKDPLLEKITAPQKEYSFITDKQLEEIQEEPIEWLIEKWICEGDICFIAGKAASFKSTLVTHLTYVISEGMLAFNKYNVKKSNVLYINEENSRKVFKQLVTRVKKGLSLENLRSENIHYSTMRNLRFESEDDVKAIIEYINSHNIKVLILDSFRRFFLGKENDADVVNRIFSILKYIRNNCGEITIILLHHAKKDNSQQSDDIRDILRGSSDIVNFADSVIGIKRNIKGNKLVIEHIKNRSGEEVKGKILQIENSTSGTIVTELGDYVDSKDKSSKLDECIEEILQNLKDKGIKIFARRDLSEIESKFNIKTIQRALNQLVVEGLVKSNKAGTSTTYELLDY